MRIRWMIPLCAAFSLCAGPAWASGIGATGNFADEPARLGAVSFPTSCSAAVQDEFNTAVAWLHSFEYDSAEKTFQDVAAKDPQCAMAHWGEALSLYHALWDQPGLSTRKEGWRDIEEARTIGVKTDRERDYIAAVEAFYRDPEKEDHDARAAAYAAAMEKVYMRYPQDHEAAAFYGLALISEEPPKDDPLANRRKAGAILEKLFAEAPDHPGAAHYIIHAYDTPELAHLALVAARRYAQIAPSSSHALHMPSHIFSRLGLWQESIDSNLAAAAAAEKAGRLGTEEAHYQTHAMDFLQYAYLQTGQDEAAERLIGELKSVPRASAGEIANDQADFTARLVIETHDWKRAAALTISENTDDDAKAAIYKARAIGKAHLGDAAGAEADLKEYNALKSSAMGSMHHPSGYEDESVGALEGSAWVAFAEKKEDEAIQKMRTAAEKQDKERVDNLVIPAREMLGDLLLECRKPADALAAYEVSLKEAPNRFDGLYGAARAAELAGNREKASAYYSALLKQTEHAQGRSAELAEAKMHGAGK